MSRTSGMGRRLQSARSPFKASNLIEQRGTLWQAVTDFFFGATSVDYDWRATSDNTLLTKWVMTQDGVAVSVANVTLGKNELDIGLTAGPDPNSNQRDVYTIPQTGSWGIAHAIVEIKSEAFSQAQGYLPQHGFGLRTQEDTQRRTIAAWHDVFVGNPNVINVGVWQGNLDGSNFMNRGGSATFDLTQHFNITAGSRVGGTVTATCTAHLLKVDDWINVSWTREFASVTVSRAANVVTCTPGSGHGFQAGDVIAAGLSSPASFDGTFTITSVNATQVFWAQTGINESGTCKLKDQASDVTQVQITNVIDANTFQYVDGKHDLPSLGVSANNNARNFPYWMEVKVDGSIVYVRCWGRHQTKPTWFTPNQAFNCDLNVAHTTYTVTASSRTAGTSTLTIGAHRFAIGNRIDVDVTDASFDTTNGFVTGFNATQVMYANAGTDTGSGGTGTCLLQGGSALASQIADIPTPIGSGRIALVANHEGIVAKGHVSYGEVTGTNSLDSTFVPALEAIETEIAQPIARTKIKAVGQVVETEVAQPITRLKIRAIGQVVETEAAQSVARVKLRAVGQVSEAETVTAVGRTKTGAILQVVETEVAQSVTRVKLRSVLQATEAEVAQPVARTKLLTLGQALEAEAATALSRTKLLGIGQALESELGQPIQRLKLRTLGQATELELAQVIVLAAGHAIGQALETEIAQPITPLKIRAIGQAVEAEIAQSVTRVKARAILQAVEAETASVIGRFKSRIVNQAIEIESASTISTLGMIRQVIELETAMPITPRKIRVIGQAVEAELVQPMVRVKSRVLGQVTEAETAFALGRVKTQVIAEVIELESGLTIVRLLPPTDEPPSGVGISRRLVQGQTTSRHGAQRMVTNGKVRII